VDARDESIIEGTNTIGGQKKDSAKVLKGAKKNWNYCQTRCKSSISYTQGKQTRNKTVSL
jgi:hypothetical protein